MRKITNFILLSFLLFTGCFFEKPFDSTLLDDDYWSTFSFCIDQVAFDNFAISSSGYYSDNDIGMYIYNSDVLDTLDNNRLYFLHVRENNRIISSYYNDKWVSPGDYVPFIHWQIDDQGIIQGCEKFHAGGSKSFVEKYKFEYLYYEDKELYGDMIKSFRIIEKKRFNSRGELIETIEYSYLEDWENEETNIE